jgi:hypothetical protein
MKKTFSLWRGLYYIISHALFQRHLTPISWVWMIRNQIVNLTPSLSFVHNLNFKHSNEQCELIFNIYISRSFQWFKECPIWTLFTICIFIPKIENTMRRRLLLKWENHLGVLKLTFSHLWEYVWILQHFFNTLILIQMQHSFNTLILIEWYFSLQYSFNTQVMFLIAKLPRCARSFEVHLIYSFSFVCNVVSFEVFSYFAPIPPTTYYACSLFIFCI